MSMQRRVGPAETPEPMRKEHDVRDDDGFTLVELIIAIGLFVLVMGLVGTFMINSLTTQKTVRSVSEATSQGQLVARSVKAGVTNASGIRLTDLTSGATAGGQLLVARTLGTGATASWGCQAWYFSGDGGAVYTTRSSGAIAAPTSKTPSWTLLVDNVGAPSAGSGIFSATTVTARVNLTVKTDGGSAVRIDTSATVRNPEAVSSPCF